MSSPITTKEIKFVIKTLLKINLQPQIILLENLSKRLK